jgi:glutathione S-transferase
VYRLYRYSQSANSYKIELLFQQLDIALTLTEVDITKGRSHTASFAKLNPFELTPVLELEKTGETYVESNAILWHVARGTPLGPRSPAQEYETLKWMFFEQNLIEPNIGRARRLLHSEKLTPAQAGPQLVDRQNTAVAALKLLDRAIGARKFLVDDSYGIADIALFAYTHVAPQAGVPLEPYANVKRWVANVLSTPRFRIFPPSTEN